MLIGGFQNVDMTKLTVNQAQEASLHLPFDADKKYTRQIFTNNGRTATIYLLANCMRFKEDDVLLLPDYLCLSVLVSVEHPKVKYNFYHINRDLSIDMDSLQAKIDEHVKGIYIIPYFGMPFAQETVDALKSIRLKLNIPIIEDITQTLLTCMPGRFGFGDYLVGSTRKWFPMTDGGFLAAHDDAPWKSAPLADAYNEAAYKQLLITLIREYYDAHPDLSRDTYLDWEAEANRSRYTDLTVREMTGFAQNVLFSSDMNKIAARRVENYNYLYERLKDVPQLSILSKPMDRPGLVPFGFVLLTEKRDELYNYLAQHDIVGEIQWKLPTDHYTPGVDALYLSEHNLMLHCDQRYTEKEMEAVAAAVMDFFKMSV